MPEWLLGLAQSLRQGLNSRSQWLLGLASGWWQSFWQWLADAKQAQVTFLGLVVGFVTLCAGALLGWWQSFWQWLADASQGQATFLGWVVGFVTLGAGALLNAHFNRRRDDRLRREDQRAVATALRAELEGLRRALTQQTESLKRTPPLDAGYQMSDLSQLIRIMPEMVSKFGLLDQETILSVMDAYVFVEEHYSQLLTLGGTPQPQFSPARVLWLPPNPIPSVLQMNASWSKVVQEAIAKLDAFLART